MSFPATYHGWGHLGEGGSKMTRTASAALQYYPSYLPPPTKTRTSANVTKTATVTPTVMVPAGIAATEDPAFVPEVMAAPTAAPRSPLMRALPFALGLLAIGGAGYAFTRRK